MLELIGFIALVAIIFGVSFSGAISIIVKAIIWIFGIMIALSLLNSIIEKLKEWSKPKPAPRPPLPTIKPYKKLTKKPGIEYKYDLLDPIIRTTINVIFGSKKYNVNKMSIYIGKDNMKKIKGFEKWLIELDVLYPENIAERKDYDKIYKLKMTDIDEFAKLVGLSKE